MMTTRSATPGCHPSAADVAGGVADRAALGHAAFERAQLRRLRRAALVEAFTLVLLLGVAVPLKHLAGVSAATAVIGPIHGLAFLAYCWTVVETVSGGGWTRARLAGCAVLGLVVLLLAPMAVHLVRAMAHPAPPPDVGTVKATANNRYRVRLAAEASPVPLQRVHRWTARVERPDGAAVDGPLTATLDGGMPQHGHGLPTQPRVTGRLPDGRLVIDGVKFSMPGWWELRLHVAGPAGPDSVTFNLAL